jgi:hypothetical protein
MSSKSAEVTFLFSAIISLFGILISMTLIPSLFYPSIRPVLALASSDVLTTEEISSVGIQTVKFPRIYDTNVKADYDDGLEFPSSMAFVGRGDILVLEKNNRTVQWIIKDEMVPKPMLEVSISNQSVRGMLGIGQSIDGAFDITERYNSKKDEWSKEESMPTAPLGLEAIALKDKI